MPLLLPITETGSGASVQNGVVTFSGSSEFIAQGEVAHYLSVRFDGSSQFIVPAGVEFNGSSTFAATLRRSDEPSQFGEVTFAGESSFVAQGSKLSDGAVTFSGSSEFIAQGTVTTPEEDSFVIYVDILDTALVPTVGTGKRYSARLIADGIDIPITAFSYREPSDRLGAVLSVTLARPDPGRIADGATLNFDLGIWNGGAWTWVALIVGGKLSSGDSSIGFAQSRPTDGFSINIVDVLGDRAQRAPRTPVMLYDPLKVDLPETPDTTNAIRDENGAVILPVNVERASMKLQDVLNYAYVTGCGFQRVTTNITNFPVSRADFTLEGGYDAGVRPLLGLFEPLYFTSDAQTLWIVDADSPLPAGFTPLELPLSAVVSVQASQPPRELANALIVSFQSDETNGDYFTERLDQDESESGSFGQPDFTSTETVRRVREYRNLAQPSVIVREVVVDTTTTVYNSDLEIVHREVQVDRFDAAQRKTGHTRTVEALVPNLDVEDAPLALLTTQSETQSIGYRPHPFRPREMVQDNVTTRVSGLVHVDKDNKYRDEPFKLPLTDAHRNGLVDSEGDQTTEFAPIRTTRESLRVRGDRQLDVSVVVVDHIANTTERSSSTTRSGGSSSLDARRVVNRQVLIKMPGTDALGKRIPSLQAGEIPEALALEMGKRKLRRLNSPPRNASVQLPDVNLALRKGTPVRPHNRSGASGTFVCTGREISGATLGTGAHRVQMRIEARELLT
ncbi:MAG: hypothetical protein H0W76_01455 [Pyrinomonadaceae bacterium]|nr:hypothetical protein [Pyrinomonadaceae bacterium]